MPDQKKGMSKGCMIALIIGLVILFIVVALSIICYVYRDELKGAVMERMTETVAAEIKTNLPEGVTIEDVDRIMEDFKEAYLANRVDAEELNDVSTMVSSMMSDKKIDKEEGKKLLDKLRKIIE